MEEKNDNLLKKTIILIFLAFISKGLGFIRELVLANYFGTSYISDVFVAVQNIPSVIFSIFGIAITTGFIPIYTEICTNKSERDADKFANNIFNIFAVLAFILTFLGIIFSKQLVLVFAGGFKGEVFELCNNFTKIVIPTAFAIILVYVYNAYLQLKGRFNQNSLMNVPYNIILVVSIIFGSYYNNSYILAFGLLFASFSQLIYLFILVKKKTSFKHHVSITLMDKNIYKMLILVGPVFISTGVNQINNIIDKSLASTLTEGSVSALNYSIEIINIISQVLILSLTTVLYPKMTKIFLSDNQRNKEKIVSNTVKIVNIIVIPLSIYMHVYSNEIVSILFGRGRFDYNSILYVSRVLKIYCIGIFGFAFRDVLNKIFYALKDTKTPMKNGLISVVFNILLNFLLIKKFEYLGLAIATVFSSTLCTLLLFVSLIKKYKTISIKSCFLNFFKVILSSIIVFIILNICYQLFKNHILIKCLFSFTVMVVIYVILLILLKEDTVLNFMKWRRKNED